MGLLLQFKLQLKSRISRFLQEQCLTKHCGLYADLCLSLDLWRNGSWQTWRSVSGSISHREALHFEDRPLEDEELRYKGHHSESKIVLMIRNSETRKKITKCL